MFHHRSSVEKKGSSKRAGSTNRRTGESRGPVKRLNNVASTKQDRLNTMKQLRQAKKDELMARKRMGADWDERATPPKVVALIGFHTQANVVSLKRQILAACGQEAEKVAAVKPHDPAVAALPPFAAGGPGAGKPRVLLVDPPRDMLAVLDVAKCADVVVVVMGPHASLEEPAFDDHGYNLLTALKAQGLPVVLGAVHGDSDSIAMASNKKIADGKKFVARYFATELGAETKLFQAGTPEEVKILVRALGGVTPKDLSWRSDRGYMLAQEVQYTPADGVLCLRGYVRGPGLSCRHLTHLTGHGDFPLAQISVLPDPCPVDRAGEAGQERIVDQRKADEPTAMQRLRPYDPTMAEQSMITAEELGETDASMMPPPPVPRKKKDAAMRIPKPEGAEDVEMDGEAGEGESGAASDDDGASMAPSGIAETDDGWDVSSNMTMEEPNAENVAAERKRRQEMIVRSQEELEFPDEVDTPLETPARERFQKYRGLKSFRTSPWDPYEDLPTEYSRIFEFEAFGATSRAFKQQYADDCYDLEGGGVSALYCAIYIKDVPPAVFESQPRGVPFVLSNLFPCEEKVSVVHGTVTRHKGHDEPIKSKAELALHCGFRRLSARTTFSEIPKKSSSCKKYRFLRFLHQDVTACASFYAPTIFPPSRLMMFAQTANGPELVASGSVDTVDPKRLVIKKIKLTGYPFRTHKSKAVVRFMFFNPTDVRWFKPVELTTKKGLRGHIHESVGTHGYMKCRFNNHIKQDDTVCMDLYKRAYPKWYPPSWGGSATATAEDA